MATVEVTFTLDKPDGSAASIVLAPDGEQILLDFDDDNKAMVPLNGKRDYPFLWEFIGKHGDVLNVEWEGDGISGLLIRKFKIDRNRPDTRPWPGGLWKSIGYSTFLRIEP